MGGKVKQGFLSTDENRLIVILLLTVIYPIFVASFFVLFLFFILPSVLASPSSPPGYVPPGMWPEVFWLLAALVWMLLLAAILPLMKGEDPDIGTASYKRGSGVSVRLGRNAVEQNNNSPVVGKDRDANLETISLKSVSRDSIDSERCKLTQSGEFMDCLQDSLKEDRLVHGTTEIQVHSKRSSCNSGSSEKVRTSVSASISKDDSLGDEIDTEVTKLLKNGYHKDAQPIQDLDNTVGNSDDEQTSLLKKSQAETRPKIRKLTNSSDGGDDERRSLLNTDETNDTDDTGGSRRASSTIEDPALGEPARIRTGKGPRPLTIDIPAHQVACATSSFSPRQSNVVFVYINSHEDEAV